MSESVEALRSAISAGLAADASYADREKAAEATDALLARLAEAETAVTQERYFRDEAVAAVEADRDDWKERAISREAEVRNLRAALAEAENLLRSCDQVRAAAEARLAETQTRERISNGRIVQLEARLAEAEKRVEAAEEAIEDFLADYEQGEGSLRASVERLRAALDPEQQP